MMEKHNPYSCTLPGNLFVGYEDLRRDILDGCRNGHSFAIIGGRRIGKTSLLLQLKKDALDDNLNPFKLLPRYLDIQSLNDITPFSLFEKLYTLTTQNVSLKGSRKTWHGSVHGKEYDYFKEQLQKVKPKLDKRYGDNWLIIFLIDELDNAADKLPDDQFFHNLRHFLTVSRFRGHFGIVASGVNMERLTTSGSPLANILGHHYLGILDAAATQQLIHIGFNRGLPGSVGEALQQITGCHPYILQGLLEKLWNEQSNLNELQINDVAKAFLREHGYFSFGRWLIVFGSAEHAVYQVLAREKYLSMAELKQRVDSTLNVQQSVTVLGYHGIVDDRDDDKLQIAGTLFRDWYNENASRISSIVPSQQPAILPKAETERLLKRVKTWCQRKIEDWSKVRDNPIYILIGMLLLLAGAFKFYIYPYILQPLQPVLSSFIEWVVQLFD